MSNCMVLPYLALVLTAAEPSTPRDVVETLAPVDGQVTFQLDAAARPLIQPDVAASAADDEGHLTFAIAPGSLRVIVSNGQFRAIRHGGLPLGGDADAPLELAAADALSGYDMVVRDVVHGHDLFGVMTPQVEFDAQNQMIGLTGAVLQLTREGAALLGAPELTGHEVGGLSLNAAAVVTQRSVTERGEIKSVQVLPEPDQGGGDGGIATAGPDVIVWELPALTQAGRNGSIVGLGLGTTSCNIGDQDLHWFAMPNTDHPIIPQNLYRLKNDQFIQIGQSWLKHAFTSLNESQCGACQDPLTGTLMGPNCSDPYSSSLNASQGGLGSRAWVNPYTGAFPNTARNHTGHTHNGASHRVRVHDDDLNPALNAGAIYYAEGQYVTPHEYSWYQSNGNQNMFNNASYKRFNISGGAPGGTWTFASGGSTVRQQPAINAWTGATRVTIEPNPGTDGRAILAYKVTDLGNDRWHYEYALYNMNFDRSFGRFKINLPGCDVAITNTGFNSPRQEPGFANDGTGGVGYSATPWTVTANVGGIEFATETHSSNEYANACRWGTLYNFRFDADAPPVAGQVELGIFKPGSPTNVLVSVQVPQSLGNGAPQIVTHPQSQSVGIGDPVTFSVVANGAALSYQWRKDGSDILGANATSYQIASATLADAGLYDVVITNPCGNVDSNDATLTVGACDGCDTNCDGTINAFDIQPMVDLLGKNPPSPCSPCAGDTNGDGSINPFDIQGLVDCLGG